MKSFYFRFELIICELIEATMEFKSLTDNFGRDVDMTGRKIVGYFSAFNSKDSDGDIIRKGAYTKTITERGPNGTGEIKHLLDHDRLKAVGKITLLEEDDYGLKFESIIGRHQQGEDYLLMNLDGIISVHSVGYNVIKETKQDSSTNVITEMKLFEGSGIQAWAANINTPVTGIKSFEDTIEMIRKLEKSMRNATYSDESFIQIEKSLKGLHDIALEYLTKNSIQEIVTTLTTEPLDCTLPGLTDVERVKEVKKDYRKIIETAFKN